MGPESGTKYGTGIWHQIWYRFWSQCVVSFGNNRVIRPGPCRLAVVAILPRPASGWKGSLENQPGRDFGLPVPGGWERHGVREEVGGPEAQAESEPGEAEVLSDPCRAYLRQVGFTTRSPTSDHWQRGHFSGQRLRCLESFLSGECTSPPAEECLE